MLSVEEALAEILAAATPAPKERIDIAAAARRVLAADVVATTDQPPFRASAMDGYAARVKDLAPRAILEVIGEAAAGAPFEGSIGAKEAVRIFTGAIVPDGADCIVIQEEATRHGGQIVVNTPQKSGRHIRETGVDFSAGSVVKKAGVRLTAIDVALIAAANVGAVEVFKKPIIAHFDNGDELVEPGATLAQGAIVGSNRFALESLICDWGASPLYLGRARDDEAAIIEKFRKASEAEILVTVGGASIGDHDFVRSAFAAAGGDMIFSKISVKPGKPTWFGRMGGTWVLGLPGNPASAIVCAVLFLRPLIAAIAGHTANAGRFANAVIATPMPANGPRENYIRGRLSIDDDGRLSAAPFADQDSSLLSPLADGNCLIRRAADAAAARAGEIVDCVVYRSPFER